jgi:hypothetical protein
MKARRRRLLVCDDCRCVVYVAQQHDGTLILVGGGGRIHAVGNDAKRWLRG